MTNTQVLAFSFAVNVILAIVAGYSARQAARAVQVSRHALSRNAVDSRRRSTVEQVMTIAPIYRALLRELGDDIDFEQPEVHAKLLDLVGTFEHLAAGVNGGAFDLEILNKTSGGLVLGLHGTFVNFIRFRRRNNPRIYDELESLVDKLRKIEASVYVVDRKAIAKVWRALPDDAIVGELKKIDASPMSYSQLIYRLTELGIDHEKTIIVPCTRRDRYEIVPYQASHHDGVIELFQKVAAGSGGLYPPNDVMESSTSLDHWIFTNPAISRYVALDDGQVIGHVEIAQPDDEEGLDGKRISSYWLRAFKNAPNPEGEPYLIIKKLGVAPWVQGRGLGRLLARHAIREIETLHGKTAALVVLTSLTNAQHLYESEGGERIGEFQGRGENRLYTYIF